MKNNLLLLALVPLLLVTGYLGLSTYVLETLRPIDLVQMRMLDYSSEAEPVIFPIPGVLKDAYWSLRGRNRVAAAPKSLGLQKFVVDLEAHATDTGEKLDAERVVELRKLLSVPGTGSGSLN